MGYINEIENGIKCPVCGYNNRKFIVETYGTCNGCRSRGVKTILDNKRYYHYMMNKSLKLWRTK